MPVCKEVLNKGAIHPGHASVVNGESKGKEIPQISILDGLRLCLQNLPAGLALLWPRSSTWISDGLRALKRVKAASVQMFL